MAKHIPWGGRLPRTIRLTMEISIDPSHGREWGQVGEVDKEYTVDVSMNGAVFVVFGDGYRLGAKPHEFEVETWHVEDCYVVKQRAAGVCVNGRTCCDCKGESVKEKIKGSLAAHLGWPITEDVAYKIRQDLVELLKKAIGDGEIRPSWTCDVIWEKCDACDGAGKMFGVHPGNSPMCSCSCPVCGDTGRVLTHDDELRFELAFYMPAKASCAVSIRGEVRDPDLCEAVREVGGRV